MRAITRFFIAALCCVLYANTVFASDATVPLKVELEAPTCVCLGVKWFIEGDRNENAVCKMEYRRKGDAEWRKAQPLLRLENAIHPEYKVAYGNLLAGSIFNLNPATDYEIKLELSDADGGGATQTLSARTRNLPATQSPAIKVLEAGTYDARALDFSDGTAEMPSGFRGADPEKVIINGRVELNGRKFVHLENVTVNGEDGDRGKGVDITGSTGVVVRHCRISAGYLGIRGGIGTRDAYVADNTIRLSASWDGTGRPGHGGYGICMQGHGNVICFNRITDCWDGISLASTERDASSIDVYGNEIERCVDDGIECDYVRTNIRVFNNRITNSLCALSAQPSFGGPVYFLRNDIYNCRGKIFKFHVNPSGIIACHNTSVASGNGWSGGDWSNGHIYNNLILGNKGFKTISTTATKSFADYNGVSSDDVRMGGIEHGVHLISVSIDDFVKAAYPHDGQGFKEGYGRSYAVDCRDLRLKAGVKAVDAGKALPNINDGFAGNAPDLGAHECGTELPHYGPRNGLSEGSRVAATAAVTAKAESPAPVVAAVAEKPKNAPAQIDADEPRNAIKAALQGSNAKFNVKITLKVLGENREVLVTGAEAGNLQVRLADNTLPVRWKDVSDDDLARLAVAVFEGDAQVLYNAGLLAANARSTLLLEKITDKLFTVDIAAGKKLQLASPR